MVPILLSLVLLAGWPGTARAVHLDVLELDGNTAPVTLDDWDNVYLGTDTALTSTFLTDLQTPSPPGDVTTFATGAQDPHFISSGANPWQCNSDNNPQAQTNLQEAYAALYKVNSHYELFFGANREKVEGTFTMGWWFFQDKVSCTAPPTGAATFTGKKRQGDLLVIADFATGGDTPTGFKAYMWTDPDGIPENGDECLGDGVDCSAAHSGEAHPAILGGNCQVPTDPNSILCGTVNTVEIDAAWRADIGPNRFWEAGIDLSQTVFADRCYLTFMAETRSSTVLLTASLKDFVLGEFNSCARLVINKETIGGNATFTFDVTQGTLTPDPFSLEGGESQEFPSVPPGTYVITEEALGGWSLTSLECTATGTGTSYQKDLDNRTVTITMEAGGNVECTFTNTAELPSGTDVSITKSDDPDAVFANGTLTYTLLVENASAVDAHDVVVTDTLPAGTTFVSCTPPPGTTCDELSGVVTADLGTIPAGESRTITIVVTAPPPGGLCPGTLVNLAEVSATDDGNSTNNSDNEETECIVASASITVDKITDPAFDPTLFDFTITLADLTLVDSFSLADQDPPHTTTVAAPGSYIVSELPETDWVTTEVICTGGPFGSAGAVYTGTPFTVNPDDHVTCTFKNKMVRPGPPDFCNKSAVTSLLSPAGARFKNNLGLDHLVVLKYGESIQAALDAIGDENGDGYVLIGVIYDDATKALGGHTTQHFEINRVYPVPFALIGCSVTVHDDDLGNDLPTARIAPTASNPLTSPSSGTYQHANVLVVDVHGADSEVAGWLVEGVRREARSVQASGNPVGVLLAGNNNKLVNGAASGNSEVGVLITGSGNYVDTYQAHDNGANGFKVTGASNTIYRGSAGDKGKGNGGHGIFLSNSSASVVREGKAYANGGDGIHAAGARHQVLKSIAGDSGKGNGGDGIHAAGTGILLQENRSRFNRGDGIDVQGGTAAAPNRLRSNLSNTGVPNGSAENAGAEYLLLGSVNNAGGGNKADGILVPKLTAPQKCPDFPATNTTKTFSSGFACE